MNQEKWIGSLGNAKKSAQDVGSCAQVQVTHGEVSPPGLTPEAGRTRGRRDARFRQ